MDHVVSVLCFSCFPTRLFIDALWSPAGKGLTSWPSFVMFNYEFVTFPLVSWVRCGQIVSIPDRCPLSYFDSILELCRTFPIGENDPHMAASFP